MLNISDFSGLGIMYFLTFPKDDQMQPVKKEKGPSSKTQNKAPRFIYI